MKKVMTMRPSQSYGQGVKGKKCCKQVGHGFFSNVGKFLNKTGRVILGQAKKVLPVVAKELAPTLITSASAKISEQALKAGVPDAVINLGNQLAQQGAQSIQKSAKESTQGLSDNQKRVSNFITDKSADLLGSLLSRAESKGSGVRLFSQGRGVKNFGGSLLRVEASSLDSRRAP